MEKKLFKEVDFYGLKIDDKIVGLNNDSTNKLLNYPFKLSLKNCQAIEDGYDLNELAKEKYPYKVTRTDFATEECRKIWIDGFQKALEILGDKKFTEEDMEDSFCEGKHRGIDDYNNRETGSLEYYDYINKKRTQQTEWDVWLVMACGLPDGCTEPEVSCTCDIIPSLDADGCLILKRKI